MAKIPENHVDTIISLNRGLKSVNNRSGVLDLLGKVNDNGLLEYFYSNDVMKNMCPSQPYHRMDFFDNIPSTKTNILG